MLLIGVWYVAEGSADFGVLTKIDTSGDYSSPALAVLAGIAFSFFAMTGFENTANVAEETIEPYKAFPRSLVGGMVVAGLVYVLVSMAAALTVPTETLASSDAALLEVVKAGILPVPTDLMATLFSIIALVAITNTTLVTIVTQPRILYGMAREDVVPGVFAKIHPDPSQPVGGPDLQRRGGRAAARHRHPGHRGRGGIDLVGRLATVTVVLLLAIYALVIVSCLKLRGQDEHEEIFRANTPLLVLGLIGNLAILGFTVYDDPHSLIWCAGLLGVGLVLFLAEHFFGSRGTGSRTPDLEEA